VPIGFDAVAQCRPRLLRTQLDQNLLAAGLSTLSARVPYATAQLAAEVRAAAAAHLSQLDLVRTPPPAIELRLLAPVAATFSPLEIAWTLELNLVRAREPGVAAAVDRGELAHLAGVGLAAAHPRAADLVLADALETLEAGVQREVTLVDESGVRRRSRVHAHRRRPCVFFAYRRGARTSR
jgi:hypothetical protein